MNKIKDVKVDVLGTIGDNLVFKKINNVVYQYVNNQKTDTVLGVNIEVFSTKNLNLYTIKVLDPAFVNALDSQNAWFGKPVQFSNLKMVPYISKNFINWSISAEQMVIKNV